ncbi:MAG TPA: D-hexose-6-phosphate mutarotase [Thermoanaerobaculia bacterium]|nr:D-hexose-6-phosphate mutarotase [Thermoanaerobaculia bacterium]
MNFKLRSGESEGEVYAYGAHVTRFNDVLFMSEKSHFTPGKAIRGGIPVIFPWFGAHGSDPARPAHGFARTMEWRVIAQAGSSIALQLESNEATRALWPHEFRATVRVSVESRLSVSLEVENTSEEAFVFEEALHTYLRVGDIRQVAVFGLEGASYIDKTDEMKEKQARPAPLTIDRETDSVFLDTEAACRVEDQSMRRSIIVEKSGSRSTIVWNPHAAKAKALSDFGDDEWERMICIEAANVAGNAVRLDPGQTSLMTTVVTAADLS